MSFSEPLPALDALFLYLESPRTPMHIGSVALFEGGPFKDPDGYMRMDAIRARMESRLDLVPKLRRRVRFSPLGVAGPVWVDDVDFDIARHVRPATLARPGTETQLLELTADLLALPMDRRHPLWELWFVDGLAGGRVALIEKLHHAVADGLASVELATVLLDFERDPPPRPAPVTPWRPRRAPLPVTVVARDLVRRGTHPLRTGVRQVAAVRHPWSSARQTTELAGALGTLITVRSVAPRCSINVKVGQRRRLAFVRQPLEPLRQAERRFGVTINDLVLTAVAGGLRALVGGRGNWGTRRPCRRSSRWGPTRTAITAWGTRFRLSWCGFPSDPRTLWLVSGTSLTWWPGARSAIRPWPAISSYGRSRRGHAQPWHRWPT